MGNWSSKVRFLFEWEIDLLGPLISNLELIFISKSFPDKRVWTFESSGRFSCKSFFKVLILSNNFDLSFPAIRIWKSQVPPRVKAFVWSLVLNHINTMDLLQRRRSNMTLSPNWCILCKKASESSKHIFIHCGFTESIWNYFFSTMKRSHVWPEEAKDFLCQWYGGGQGKWTKIYWECLLHGVLWGIWKERNRWIFEGKTNNNNEVIDFIVREVGNWTSVLKEF